MKETLPHTIDKLFWNIAVNDDENAFKTLFFQFFSPLCIFAHRYIERWETCEDVVQESFLKIWENRKSIRIETSARNFLVTSVRNNCIDYLRKQELELAWKQWKISKGDEPSGDIYSIVELERCWLKHWINYRRTLASFSKRIVSKERNIQRSPRNNKYQSKQSKRI